MQVVIYMIQAILLFVAVALFTGKILNLPSLKKNSWDDIGFVMFMCFLFSLMMTQVKL